MTTWCLFSSGESLLRNGYNRIRYDVWRLFEKLHLTSQLSAIYCIVSYGPKFELQMIKPNRYGQCTQGRCSTIPRRKLPANWKIFTGNFLLKIRI